MTKHDFTLSLCNIKQIIFFALTIYRVCIKNNETYFLLTWLYIAACMLQANSMKVEVSFNTCWMSITYKLLCGLYRGFSGPLSLGSVERRGGGGDTGAF